MREAVYASLYIPATSPVLPSPDREAGRLRSSGVRTRQRAS